MPIGGIVTDRRGCVPGPKSGRLAGSTSSMPGRLTTTIVASRAMPAGLAPGGQVHQAVGADQEEQLVLGPLAVDRLQRLDAVMRAGPRGLDVGDLERRVAGDRDPGHLQAMGDRRPVAPLVRRRAGDHEPDPVQAARLAALLGQDQVAQVDRVERPAEKPQSHRQKSPRRTADDPPGRPP